MYTISIDNYSDFDMRVQAIKNSSPNSMAVVLINRYPLSYFYQNPLVAF